MNGVSSVRKFRTLGLPPLGEPLMMKQYHLLLKGCFLYWVLCPSLLYAATGNIFFLIAVWLQPLLCMTFFLAVINWGFHAFIHFDEAGVQVPCVNSLCIVDGDDDYFGEDDHMAHHYSPSTWWTKTHEFQAKMHAEITKYHG